MNIPIFFDIMLCSLVKSTNVLEEHITYILSVEE
jgi:hypothetical protein